VVEALVAVAVAAAATTYAVGVGTDPATPGPSSVPGPSATRPSELAVVAITGAKLPFVVVVGAGPAAPPAVIALPPSLAFTAPGQGETNAAEVAALPGDSMRVAVSNAIGAWARHYGLLDLDGLAALVERSGGITVGLSEPVVAGPDVLGPGNVELSGPDTVTFLFEADRKDTTERFILVLGALLGAPPKLTEEDLLATDDAAGLGKILRAARGAGVTLPPTRQVAGTVTVPDQPAFDEYLGQWFGTEPPIPAIVQNGSGEPAIGEAVARKLIPAGFRIVLSGNAVSFDHRVTDVLAEGPEHVEAARRARRALGVGRVGLSQVPSGIGDITVVVGKDFNG
jgi:hypothetical protein